MIILVFLVIFKILFLTFPSVVLAAAREGLLLWLNNIVPALLPFMIITNMLVEMEFPRFLGETLTPVMKKIFNLPGAGGFALITGLTSGYPIGAKAVADLRKTGEISARDAQHLLAFCNNAGPLFILGVVGIGLFGNAAVGYVLWTGHVFSALLLGILLKFLCRSDRPRLPVGYNFAEYASGGRGRPPLHRISSTLSSNSNVSPGKALSNAVKNAMESMAIIGGLVIFFNATMAILGEIGLPDKGLLAGFITGAVEVTGGVRKISECGISTTSLAFAAFAIAFGGLSIHMQTFHFTESTGIKAAPYLFCKVLHGLLAATITIFLARLFV